MHNSVFDNFAAFTRQLEGYVLWPYLDVLGLVTIGYGCLIDPWDPLAKSLPWKHADGSPASDIAARAQWQQLKAHQELKSQHYKYAAAVTTIRLTEADVEQLLRDRMAASETTLRRYFPGWDSFPADAQLCCMSMAWAVGPGFPAVFKNFTAFANAGDWASAAKCAAIKTDGNPGIVPRNAQNQLCLANAAAWVGNRYPAENLWWPANVHSNDFALAAEASAALARWSDRERSAPPDAASNIPAELDTADTDPAPPPDSEGNPEA